MGDWRGMTIAFLGGLFFTCYVFLADHQKQEDLAPWPLFGIELVTMAGWAMLIALLFGDWQSVHPSFPKDIWVILYIAGATTFLPTLITVLMQKYVSPVTVSFIYILEPILGAIVANMYLHETLPLQGYFGGGLIVVGTIINTLSVSWGPNRARSFESAFTLLDQRIHRSFISLVSYPLLLLGISFVLLFRFGGFPPIAWFELYRLWPGLSALLQQGNGTFVVLLVVQASCWFIAWVTFSTMVILTIYHIVTSMISRPKTLPTYHQPLSHTRVSPGAASATQVGRKRESIGASTRGTSPTLSLLDELVS